ncbi:MAG: bifunctional diguanylate cyclase/phosphodiesterase [Thiomonas sp.]
MAVGVAVFERHELDHTRATLQAQAQAGGQQYADTVAARLHAQFIELQFVAVTLLPPEGDGPPTPSTQTVQALRSFMALHPSLYAFNIQSPDGQTIVWSTQAQSSKPITSAAGFTPLRSNPDFLLGSPRFAQRVGTYAVTMRFRVRAPDGHVRYFVGTPYKLDQLLAYPDVFRQPWRITVTDLRSGRALARWHAGRLDFQLHDAGPLAIGVQLPIGDTPLIARVQWPAGYAWSQWVQGGRIRWLLEALLLVGFALAIASAWINRRRLARQRAAFEHAARFDTLTDLPNAAGFAQRLGQLPPLAAGGDTVHCVLVLDLYRFTEFNHQHGRDNGDAVLRQVAQRLLSLPGLDTVARLEADAFGLLWRDLPRSAVRSKIAQSLLALEKPFELRSGQRQLTASVGCALLPDDADGPDAAISMAEAAVFNGAVRYVQETFKRTDPYGSEAVDVLQWAGRFLNRQVSRMALNFYVDLTADPDNAAVLALLQPQEFDHLKRSQARYLLKLTSPDLTENDHARVAQHIGALHAYLGVEPRALVQAASWYRQQLSAQVQRMAGRLVEKQLLDRVFAMRVERDLMMQTQGAQVLQNTIQSSIDALYPELMTCLNWFEALDKLMAALRAWPMLHSAAVLKQDATGQWLCEASTEEKACASPKLSPTHPVVQALHGERVSLPTLKDDLREQQGETDLAVRSLVAVPLKDVSGHTLSVLELRGRIPNQFDTPWMRVALDGLQQVLAIVRHYIATEIFTSPVTQEQRSVYRKHLFEGGLRMFMQPLLDLHQGACTKVEALARLQLPDGTVVSPGVFLPLLGEQELSRLFIDGLDLALRALRQWEAQGLRLDLSINLPPHTLIEPDCAQWITQALHTHGIAPQRLTLELLESSGSKEAAYERAITALHALGVQLAMDDLGSGYSSLQRLQRLPFDFIKIDQGLVRNLHRDPGRGVSMVGGIVRLGKALNLRIVVEGVETYDLMELSALLGADLLQGFGIAKPMPAEDVPQWMAQHGKLAVPTQTPTGLLGLLATHWLWEQGTADTLSPNPEQAHLHCGIGRYILQHGWQGTAVDRTHAAMHRAMQQAGAGSSAYKRAKEAFLNALQQRIKEEEGNEVTKG